MISKFVRSPCLMSKSGMCVDPHFGTQIREVIENATKIQGTDLYFMNLWKRTVVISTFVMNSSNVSSWHEPIHTCFLALAPGTDPLTNPLGLVAKFHYLIENIQIRPPVMQFVWWELISTELFPMFLQYPVIGLDATIVQKRFIEGKCPQSVIDDVVKLFSNPEFRAMCVLRRNSPNEITALLYLLIKVDPGNTDAILEWFMQLWLPISESGYERMEAFGLMQVYALVLPQGLVNLVQLMARYSARRFCALKSSAKSKGGKFEFHGFDVLRVIWNGPLRKVADEKLLERVLYSIVAELQDVLPLMEISTFFAFTFDLKLTSESVWDFFRTRMIRFEGPALLVCGKYMSMFAVVFAPVLFSFEYQQVIEHVTRELQRAQRLHVEAETVERKLNMLKSYWGLVSYVTNNQELEKSYADLEADGSLLFYQLEQGDWDLQAIPQYLNALWKSLDENHHAKLASRFFSSLSVIQKTVPKSLIGRSSELLTVLYEPTLQFLIDSFYHVTLFEHVMANLLRLGVHQQATPTHLLWVETVLKYLYAEEPEVQKVVLPVVVETIQTLGKESFFLIPFFVDFLERTNIVLCKTDQAAFTVSVFAIFANQTEFTVPQTILDHLHAMNEKEDKTGRYRFVRSALQVVDTMSDVLSRAVTVFHRHNSGCFPCNEFTTLFLEEMMSESGEIDRWLCDEIGLVFSRVEYRDQLLSLLSFLSRHLTKLMTKMPKFWPKVGTVYMSSLDQMSFPCQALTVETMTAVGLNGIGNTKMLFASCNGIDDRIIQRAIMSLYTKRPIKEPPSGWKYVIVHKHLETVFVVKECETGFDLMGRASAAAFSFHIEKIEHDMLGSDCITYPKPIDEKTVPFQETECQGLSKLVADVFGTCEPPVVEYPTDEHVTISSPQVEVAHPKPEGNCDDVETAASVRCDHIAFAFFSTFFDVKGGNLQVLDENILNLNLKLSNIWATPIRDYAKIGILYVREGQFDQNDILANTQANESKRFRQFLHSLGEMVDPGTHKWYLGRLSKSDGKSLYYANEMFEVMYHVSTLLFDDCNDPQRLVKKRHIGNDFVHIVWCENAAGYDPGTIVSQFNDGHVVIYPYGDNLFRVIVHKKHPEHCFLPLPSDCFVTAEALPLLVTATAIIADRTVRTVHDVPLEIFSEKFKSLIASV